MRHVKSFYEIVSESVSTNNVKIDTIINNIFKLIPSSDELENIFDDDFLIIATNVYYAFVDANELLELRPNELQEFADNMGVGEEENILFSIMSKLYEEKHHRNLHKDIEMSIQKLENNNDMLSKEYSKELQKI